MKFSEAIDIIIDMPANIAVLFVGDAGIGKSAFVRQVSERLKLKLSEFNCAEAAEPGDVIGMPDIVDGKMVIRPPEWFETGVDTLLFLDEINRPGAGAIVRAMMGFALTHKLGSVTLTPNSRIFGAINPERDNIYDVLSLDPAQLDRFWICEIECNAGEWIANFAIPSKVNQVVIDYIGDNEGDLHALSNPKAFAMAREARKYTGVLSTPRSWDMFSQTLNMKESADKLPCGTVAERSSTQKLVYNIACGFIGTVIAEKFSKYYVEAKRIDAVRALRASDIMNAGSTDWDELVPKITELNAAANMFTAKNLCTSIYEYIKSASESLYTSAEHNRLTPLAYKYGENFKRFIELLNPELVAMMYYKNIKPDAKDAPWMNAIGVACPGAIDVISNVIKAAVHKKDITNQTQKVQKVHKVSPPPKVNGGEEWLKNARRKYYDYRDRDDDIRPF